MTENTLFTSVLCNDISADSPTYFTDVIILDPVQRKIVRYDSLDDTYITAFYDYEDSDIATSNWGRIRQKILSYYYKER
jgi:hypothetical protein